MNDAGVASDADADAGDADPLVHESETVTEAPLFGTKSFDTVNVALFCVLVSVQDEVPPTEIATLAQFVWFAV